MTSSSGQQLHPAFQTLSAITKGSNLLDFVEANIFPACPQDLKSNQQTLEVLDLIIKKVNELLIVVPSSQQQQQNTQEEDDAIKTNNECVAMAASYLLCWFSNPNYSSPLMFPQQQETGVGIFTALPLFRLRAKQVYDLILISCEYQSYVIYLADALHNMFLMDLPMSVICNFWDRQHQKQGAIQEKGDGGNNGNDEEDKSENRQEPREMYFLQNYSSLLPLFATPELFWHLSNVSYDADHIGYKQSLFGVLQQIEREILLKQAVGIYQSGDRSGGFISEEELLLFDHAGSGNNNKYYKERYAEKNNFVTVQKAAWLLQKEREAHEATKRKLEKVEQELEKMMKK